LPLKMRKTEEGVTAQGVTAEWVTSEGVTAEVVTLVGVKALRATVMRAPMVLYLPLALLARVPRDVRTRMAGHALVVHEPVATRMEIYSVTHWLRLSRAEIDQETLCHRRPCKMAVASGAEMAVGE